MGFNFGAKNWGRGWKAELGWRVGTKIAAYLQESLSVKWTNAETRSIILTV